MTFQTPPPASGSVPGKRSLFSILTRLSLLMVAILLLAVAISMLMLHLLPDQIWLAAGLSLLIILPLGVGMMRSQLLDMIRLFHTLAGTVISYQDNDFSIGVHWPLKDELGELVDAHNALGDVLRKQRLDLVQRELLLDTMVQNTPVAMMLVADHGPIVFANIAARQLLNQGRKLEGFSFNEVMMQVSASLREAILRGGDGLFTVAAKDPEEEEEVYHLARRHFSLNGRHHELFLLRHLTVELRRQEVQTWKKVIRVISHELNNSLAPIASLANSAAVLVGRGQTERLPGILQTIEERTRHLESFIDGYARFAKLPTPRLESTHWHSFIAGLKSQVIFTVVDSLPDEVVSMDRAQMEHALLNLLKNAHESGSRADDVSLSIRALQGVTRIEVMDRGSGMTDTVMSNALIPFYSTKRSGTGLGLALVREIIEAHGGRISLQNREGGGLTVSLFLPLPT
ncbi:sensor histidine kinase [Undibacterium umbellatum]|jgi:two-component system nitrogen regulation sensor histidine kinase NtrY|uniref:histidine kinase n=1 Tax=Undibacterium umbellatum TaxID=2762300 RepID=A0ABR6ZEG9_9BURK|nr:sensor histidine kinase [Undibacterium umbellatum]MBC3910137.1 sensor histidine kinase [Undibacterium umbellatum]